MFASSSKVKASVENSFNYLNRKKQGSSKASALLFYKSAAKIRHNKNSSGISKSPADITHVCENHSSVVASHAAVDEQNAKIYYCQKCSQLLMKQGFEVQKLSSSKSNSFSEQENTSSQLLISSKQQALYPERQGQINKFLQSLYSSRSELNSNTERIKQILIQSEEFYGRQIEQITEYFQQIVQALELEKNKCYNHILQQRSNAEAEVRGWMQKLADGENEIAAMIEDIEGNLDSVYSISWSNYKMVIEAFEKRVSDIDNVLQQISSKGINDVQYRKIQFAGVPESINSLSEIIIGASCGSLYEDCEYLKQQSVRSEFNKKSRSLMFSFDAERMKNVDQQYEDDQCQQQQQQQCCESQKDKSINKQLNGRVVGVKQVEELDVVEVDQCQTHWKL